jgi:UDP-glucose 4-epimerase
MKILAIEKAPSLGFRKFIISATTPFAADDLAGLGVDASAVLARKFPDYPSIYAAFLH